MTFVLSTPGNKGLERPTSILPEDNFSVLSSLPPSRLEKQLALGFVLCLLFVVFLIVGPLAAMRLPRNDSFVPVYVTAMFVNDLITAILLYAQFSILRSRAVLVLASGYLFTALVLIPYVLIFPGLFVPGRGVFGGTQTTSWFWFFWHAVFPFFIIGYVYYRDGDPSIRYWRGNVSVAIAISVGLTVTIIAIAAYLSIVGEAMLPRVLLDSLRLAPLWPYVGLPVAFVAFAALIVLWMRRRSMLDLWLMVVMCIYTIEMPLCYWPDPVRFSIGWYTIRVFAVMSSALVLIVLLYETTSLYARLLQSVDIRRRDRHAQLVAGDAIAAAIAHEIRQPLSGMITRAYAGLRFVTRSMPHLGEAKEAFRHIVADGNRAAAVIEGIRANFKKDARIRTMLDVNALIEEAVGLAGDDLQIHRIRVEVGRCEKQPRTVGDKIQLQQVLLNLITNAIDSMVARDMDRELRIECVARNDGMILVSVADTGKGIVPLDVEQIFNPLFTTKSGGMGMGLSICRSIIEAHDGQLWGVPNSAAGAVFHFSLRSSQ